MENLKGKRSFHLFDQIIICAGPWTSKLLPKLAPILCCMLIPVTYWHDPHGRYRLSNGFPIIFNARLTNIYGLPSCEYPGHVKILYHGGPETDPDKRDMSSVEKYIDEVREYVQVRLPYLTSDHPSIRETCMYTRTPDGLPIIDRISKTVIAGCGFSGSGFKHAPATGKMLASLALRKEGRIPDSFGAERYMLSRYSQDKKQKKSIDIIFLATKRNHNS